MCFVWPCYRGPRRPCQGGRAGGQTAVDRGRGGTDTLGVNVGYTLWVNMGHTQGVSIESLLEIDGRECHPRRILPCARGSPWRTRVDGFAFVCQQICRQAKSRINRESKLLEVGEGE